MASKSVPPRITVAVVAYQSGAFLQRCLDALAAQDFRDFEALVIDNGSTDGSVEALKLPDKRFRIEPMGANLGFAAANTVAARMSRSEWLCMLNPDTEAEPGWLSALVAAAARWPGAASFGSTQVELKDPTRLDGVGDVWHAAGVAWRARLGRPVSETPPEGEVFGPCAAAALYRREVFLALGGFDERYFCYCEDVDWAYRARLAGWTAVQVPSAVVRHAGSGISGRASDFTLFHGHRNRVWTFAKNTPALWLPLLLPWHLAYDLAMWLSAARKVKGGRAVGRAYWAALKGLGPVLADRKQIQRLRRARGRDLARAMAWGPFAPLRRDVA
jgi:GT2 family glycosyltransferase